MMMIRFDPDLERALDDDDCDAAIRYLLIDRNYDLTDFFTPNIASLMRDRLLAMLDRLTTDERSTLMLAQSLCPIHAIDYAICFDDDDAECAAIRTAFPSHDT
jgi:hypothetical protein